jgi:membrane-associated phospholipid phosphatase
MVRSPSLRLALARALSVIGHPALLVPSAVAWAAVGRGAPPDVLRWAVGASVFVAISVLVYSAVQVRKGRWRHVDASVPQERGQLNLFLAALLLGTATLLWWKGSHAMVAWGLAVCGAVVVFALLTRHWLKVSLHAAFAVFAAALVWPNAVAVGLGLVLAAGVAWSRLVLKRHTLLEVVVGVLVGGAAGVGLNFFLVS